MLNAGCILCMSATKGQTTENISLSGRAHPRVRERLKQSEKIKGEEGSEKREKRNYIYNYKH